ncbi:MAG: hypothetical protein ACP5E2_09200 [Terracidiphilus sp.]
MEIDGTAIHAIEDSRLYQRVIEDGEAMSLAADHTKCSGDFAARIVPGVHLYGGFAALEPGWPA